MTEGLVGGRADGTKSDCVQGAVIAFTANGGVFILFLAHEIVNTGD